MFHGVYITVINGEGWLLKSPRERSPFYAACERWFKELVQCPAHGIVSQAPRRWASVFVPLVTLFLMRESLALGGSRSLPIVIIVFIIMKRVRARMRLLSLCIAQLSLQVIYLSLHGLFIILSLGYVTAHTGIASTSLSGVYAPLSKPSILFVSITFRVWEVALLLGSSQLELMGACSMRAWSYHAQLLSLLAHKFFLQTVPILGSGFEHFYYYVNKLKSHRSNTINLVENGLKNWALVRTSTTRHDRR